MSGAAKRRVAVLGGGQAALTAALQLSDPANPSAAETEVTIYQIGWRLGGKGATGRPGDPPRVDDPHEPPRIFEHGLHEWFGFYDNSFRQIREVYAELARPSDAPLATFEQAFVAAKEAYVVEWIEGKPLLWQTTNPSNDAKPGEGGLWLTPLQYVAMAIEAIEGLFGDSSLAGRGHEGEPLLARAHALLHSAHLHGAGGAAERLSATEAEHLLHAAATIARAAADGVEHPIAAIADRLKDDLERELPHDAAVPDWIRAIENAALRPLCWLLWLFVHVLWRAVGHAISTPARTAERRLWIQASFAYACIVGAIRDDVIADGFDVLNDRDLRAWLRANAYPDGDVMLHSPLVEAIYVGVFGYPRGDTRGWAYPPAENFEAGTALRGIVRTMLTYKGALVYRFAAGTGDTCYAPVYEVLRKRGVQVRFFSRIERLELQDGRIARVHFGEQAQVVGGGPYEPLVDLGGLPCWPAEPCWEQLVGGTALRAEHADFEWPSAALRERERAAVLELGRDYDDVVLGISIAALGPICADLTAAYPAWAAALEHVKTVRTQAVQLWLTKSASELGFAVDALQLSTWRYDDQSPLNVWGDFSEIIPFEHWSAERRPRSLGYFCSTMPEYPDDPFADQAAADARVRENALDLLRHGVPLLMPGLLDEHGQVRWELLADPRAEPASGESRLDAQWIRANVLPSERYVLSVVGSSRHRLAAHDPAAGPANLYLAGDWTQCTLNCGCMEAATMSGMLCASALCGYPPRSAITGADF